MQIAVFTLTPFPPGTTVSVIIKDRKASYVNGEWAAASRIEMYTGMSKGSNYFFRTFSECHLVWIQELVVD